MITAANWFEDRPWIDKPDADIARYVAALQKRPTAYNVEEYLHRWRDEGIVVFENAVDHRLIDELLTDVREFTENPDRYDLTIETQGEHRASHEVSIDAIKRQPNLKLNNFHELSARAVEASLNAPTADFLSHVFGEPACLLQSLFFIRGSQQPIHLDYPYVRVQTKIAHLAASWMALEDVTEGSGPLAYYPGSHQPGHIPLYDWGAGSIVMEKDSTRSPMQFSQHLYAEMERRGIQRKVFIPKKGDVLIWHGYLAHEGTAIADPASTRRSLIIHYSSLSAYPPLHKGCASWMWAGVSVRDRVASLIVLTLSVRRCTMPCTLAEASVQRKRMLREESIGNVDVQGLIPRLWREASIISRRRRETGRSSRVGEKRMSLLCDNSEPRPPQTTGALMFGWPPKEALQKLKLASHIRAAIVQCFAESQMATKPVVLLRFFCRNKNCGMPFFICKSCYCGQCYCGPTCREQTRRENQRENNRNYQKGFNARRLHAARQQKYRHAAKIVTEQGFILPSTYGNLGFREIQASGSMAHSMKTKIDSVRYAKCCICGRRGRWKNVEAE